MKKLISKKHFHFTEDLSEIFLSKYLDDIIINNLKPTVKHYKLCEIATWSIFVCNHIQVTSDKCIFIPGFYSFTSKQGLDFQDLEALRKHTSEKKAILIIKFVLQQVLEGKYAR